MASIRTAVAVWSPCSWSRRAQFAFRDCLELVGEVDSFTLQRSLRTANGCVRSSSRFSACRCANNNELASRALANALVLKQTQLTSAAFAPRIPRSATSRRSPTAARRAPPPFLPARAPRRPARPRGDGGGARRAAVGLRREVAERRVRGATTVEVSYVL